MAAALFLVGSVVVGGSGVAAAETVITVDAGFGGGLYAQGRPIPVRIRVSADRLVGGTIEVAVSGQVPIDVPFEVPGGSEKEFVVAVSANPTISVNTVTARLADGTASPPSGQATIRAVNDEELVGMLPGAVVEAGVPALAPLAANAGTARFFALSDAELALAPLSLEPLSTILASGTDLARLGESARQGVLRWVDGGGNLLVASPPGSSVAGLPEAWLPGPSGRGLAGGGEVRLVGSGALTSVGGLVEPTSRGGATESVGFVGPDDMSFSLANEAGFRVAQLSWLLAFLVVYVLLVGPVLYLALRRRRKPELAWVAIPVVALLFTSGAYIGGRSVRAATQVVHATVLDTAESGSTATTFLGVTSRQGETVSLAFPAGWTPLTGANGQNMGASVSTLAFTPDGLGARLPLDAGQFGVLATAGPVADSGRLEIQANRLPGGGWQGSVRNGTPWSLDAVAILVGSSATAVGSLAPGAEQAWQVAPFDPFSGGPPPEWLVWGQFEGPFGFGRDTRVDDAADLGLWGTATNLDPALRDASTAVAAGWTRAYDPPLRMGNRASRPEGRTLVVGQAPVGGPIGANNDASTTVEIVRGGGSRFNGVQQPITIAKLTLTSGEPIDTSTLRLRLPQPGVEIWTGGRWTVLDCGVADCRVGGAEHGRSSVVVGSSAEVFRAITGQPSGGFGAGGPVTTAMVPFPVPIPPTSAPACPPGAACDFIGFDGSGFELGQVRADLPAGSINQGAVFVRVSGFFPAEMFAIEGVT